MINNRNKNEDIMSSGIYLCVMSDDLGMHPAINEGIACAFTDGLLTDANIMAPCPAFREGAAIAKQIGLPTGFHATLTCDWDIYRWGPLTKAPSLTTPEGYFKHLVALAWSEAKDEEVLAEMTAQMDAIEAEGIRSTHASNHMGNDGQGRLFRALAQIGVERTGPLRREPIGQAGILPARQWDSSFFSSEWTLDYKRRRAYLKGLLRRMQAGYHLWMVHAAVDHPSLDALCSPEFFAWNWARPYRAADMSLLMDPEIKDLLEELGIQRISVDCAPLKT
jgi:chitin disaccharide deacetylase